MSRRSNTLHNMSVAPRTVISHTSRGCGNRAVVELLDGPSSLAPSAVLAWLGVPAAGLDEPAARARLHALLDEAAASLPLPPAAPVVDQLAPNDRVVFRATDRVAAATLLAKASNRVYLRDKAPILSGIVAGRRLVLVLPERWEVRS